MFHTLLQNFILTLHSYWKVYCTLLKASVYSTRTVRFSVSFLQQSRYSLLNLSFYWTPCSKQFLGTTIMELKLGLSWGSGHGFFGLKGQCHEIFDPSPWVLLTTAANRKNLRSENFYLFFCTPLGSWVNILINFSFKFTLRSQQSDSVPIICRWCRWHWWQICHWYQQHQGYWWQNLLPLSLILVVHLDLWISPRIFEKKWKWP